MNTIQQIIKILLENQCEFIRIEPDKEIQMFFSDGREEPYTSGQHFTSTELFNILNEIVPDQNRASLEEEMQFGFTYKEENIEPVEIETAFLDGSPVITIQKIKIEESKTLKSLLEFPDRVPSILNKSESAQRLRSAGIGLFFSLVIILTSYFVSGRDSLIGQILNPSNFTVLVPLAIIFLFFWGLSITNYRRRRIKSIEKISPRSLLIAATSLLPASGSSGLLKELDGEIVNKSPLLRRLQAVLRQWVTHPSVQDANIVLEQHAIYDEDEMHSSYNLLRTFVWALPVLGLIGTVLGIFFAVGGFAKFLGGSIEDVTVVKEKLVDVTGGLSYAFLITLLGLLPSLLLMFITSALQMREEKLYNTIHDDLSNIFLPVLQNVSPEPNPFNEIMETKLKGTFDSITKTQNDFLSNLIHSLNQIHSSFNQTTEKFTKDLKMFSEGVTEGMTKFSRSNSETQKDISSNLVNSLNQIHNDFSQITNQFSSNLKMFSDQNDRGIKTLIEEITKVESTNKKLNPILEYISNAVPKSVDQLSQELHTIIETNGLSKEAINSINKHTQNLEAIQQYQIQISNLLKNLSKPLEFRLINPTEEKT